MIDESCVEDECIENGWHLICTQVCDDEGIWSYFVCSVLCADIYMVQASLMPNVLSSWYPWINVEGGSNDHQISDP